MAHVQVVAQGREPDGEEEAGTGGDPESPGETIDDPDEIAEPNEPA